MDKKLLNKLQSKLTGLVVTAAILALLSAIGFLVTTNISINGDFDSTGRVVVSVLCITVWDIVRLSGFSMFVCALIFAITEIIAKIRGKVYSFVMLSGCVFGLISAFMLSFMSMLKSIYLSAYSYGSSSNYSEMSVPGIIITACVFTMVSSITVFVSLGLKSSNANRVSTYPPQNYQQPVNPQQGYMQQSYQQPVNPQQGYMQQNYQQPVNTQQGYMQQNYQQPVNTQQGYMQQNYQQPVNPQQSYIQPNYQQHVNPQQVYSQQSPTSSNVDLSKNDNNGHN